MEVKDYQPNTCSSLQNLKKISDNSRSYETLLELIFTEGQVCSGTNSWYFK